MKHILSLMLLCILFCAASCKKEQPDPPPDLPPLTNVGAMTFGCYVNGKPWVAEVPPFQAEFRHTGGTFSISKNRFIVFATRKSQNFNEGINLIFFMDSINKDSISLEYHNQYYKNFYNICNGNFGDYYFELDTFHNKNYLNVTNIDFENRQISGKFSFKARNKMCKDTALISDGRFDILFSIIE